MNMHRTFLTLAAILILSTSAATNIAAGDQPVENKQSLDSLIAACQDAKSQFRPLTQDDLKSAKDELVAALDKLDPRLKADGPNGDDWRKFLLWDELQQELRKDGPMNQAVLNRVCERYAAGNEGLGLVWFIDVRNALWRLLKVQDAIGNAKTKTTYEAILDNLGNNLKSFAAKPTTENTLAISESIRWLQIRSQAPELVQAVEKQFSQPNFYGEASADFVAAAVAQPVDENTPICDNIMGTAISGSGHTVGRTTGELLPDPNVGIIDTLLFTTTYSSTVGSHPPVCIFSTGTTCISARKRIWVNEYGVFSYPSVSNAVTHTCINDIQANRAIIERAAWKRAAQQKPSAECIASQHAEARANKRVDDQAAESLDKAQQDYIKKYRQPMLDHKVFPDKLQVSTDKEALQTVSMEVGSARLAAPAPPPSPMKTDLALRVHESMINNFALDALGGMTINEDGFQQSFLGTFGKLPEKMKRDENQPPWVITFATRQPISVSFSDGGFKILVRGTQFINGNNSCDDTDVVVTYKIEKTDSGFKAIRQGDVQILPKGKLQVGGQGEGVRSLLRKRFEKIFEPEILGKGFAFSGKLEKLGKMLPVDVQSSDGWLSIAWHRAGAEQNVQ
jgi:hypothetical protein